MTQEPETGTQVAPLAEAGAHRTSDKDADYPPIVENVDGPVVLFPNDEPLDPRPASERIASLFEEMPGRRDVLLAVLGACAGRCSDEGVAAVVAESQRENRSVFSAVSLCRILAKAGALEHVREDGSPYDEDALRPEEFAEDGIDYIRATVPPTSFWQTTPEGAAYLAADDPLARTRAVFEREQAYLPIYKFILEGAQNGAAVSDLAPTVDEHPLVQKPRLYVQHFLKQLEDSGALRWTGTWNITDCGASALSLLDDVAKL